MADQEFTTPVRVAIHDGSTVREVRTLQDACEVLIDWPHARRGPVFQEARESVEAALDGSVTAAKAEAAFLAFCDHAGALVKA